MKMLIFSDTHLTDQFDEKKYAFLKKIIINADQVIINGDFWDGYEVYFDQFINSSWKKLFPLLKKKQAIYLYGNHDKKSLSDKRISLFSVKQTERYIFTSGKRSFWIEHGNIYFPDWEEKIPIKQPNFVINLLYDIVEKILFMILGKKLQTYFFSRFNKKIKLAIQTAVPKKFIFVCGHTHAQEMDLKNRFINTGIVRHGLGQYLIVEGNKIEVREESFA